MTARQAIADEAGWGPSVASPPIGANDILRWAVAIYWPERPPRIYTDAGYGEAKGFGGVIAPRDFNPFAWMLDPPLPPPGSAKEDFPQHPRVMNGGQSDRYGVPIRPGDVITSRARIASIESRTTRLGDTRFITTEQEWSNQRGEFVRTRYSTLIRY